MGILNRFQIFKLYGYRNIDIPITNNRIIFVGENGMGKTTILKFMLAVLSGTYEQFPPYKFEKIVVTIDNMEYKLNFDEINSNSMELNYEVIRHLPVIIRRELDELRFKKQKITKKDIIDICNKKHLSVVKVLSRIDNIMDESFDFEQLTLIKKENNPLKEISNAFQAKILYLPTYRRIEENLSHVIRGKYSFSREENRRSEYDFNNEDNCSYLELVEFGMEDVKDKIEYKCSELRKFSETRFKDLAYMNLGDVIDKNYVSISNSQLITKFDIEKFKLCLSRNSKSMLSEEQISSLIKTLSKADFNPKDTHSQILLYYFRNLLSLQSDLENKEQNIIDFCNMCNNYFNVSDKKIIYDISNFKVQVYKYYNNAYDEIDMSDLSSGEKQIVSLFSHLYLSEEKNYFVIIDEPELSLSVPWQKRFLEDINNSKLCSGLISATHSPFIYDNQLFTYTHSLGEYIREVD